MGRKLEASLHRESSVDFAQTTLEIVPMGHRRRLRESLFVEERRRLKIIPNAFGKKPVLKLMFGAMIRVAERWRFVKVAEFERRQLAAVKQDLD